MEAKERPAIRQQKHSDRDDSIKFAITAAAQVAIQNHSSEYSGRRAGRISFFYQHYMRSLQGALILSCSFIGIGSRCGIL
jgi:hypothetical protein